MPGVWAAGNATNPRAQVITAAGEGSAVAIAINTAPRQRSRADAPRRGLNPPREAHMTDDTAPDPSGTNSP